MELNDREALRSSVAEMERDELTVLKKRLNRVEWRFHLLLRMLILIAVLLGLGTVALPAGSAQAPQFVRARYIEVIDDAGRPRISLNVSTTGPEILIFDETRAIQLRLSVSGSGALLTIGRQSDSPRIDLLTMGSAASAFATLSITGGPAGRASVTFAAARWARDVALG